MFVHHRDERRGFAKTTVGTSSFLFPPVTRQAAVDRSGVCWGTCFFFATHVCTLPADNYRACAVFLSVCVFPNADSFLYTIVMCRAFDPQSLVDLVCVSPRVVSTRHF
jgi:hypothetical protein